MPAELRIYDIKPGRMAEFLELFDAEVAPARIAYGFDVIGPWIDEDMNQFVWIASYDGASPWDEAEQRYRDSPERSNLSRDPMELIDSVDARMLGKK